MIKRVLPMWLGCVLAIPLAAQQVQLDGSLEFSGQQHGQKGISGTKLAAMLGGLPKETSKFLLLTQCYAGLIARNPAIVALPKTAVAAGNSAQAPERGWYGGYNDDAVRALKPEDGRTAKTVDDEGMAGKHGLENPVATGSLALGDFSLEKVKAAGPVKARVIVIYAGKPSVSQEWLKTVNGRTLPESTGMSPEDAQRNGYSQVEVSDVKDRQTIIDNFAGEPSTLIITVGGTGIDGWQFPGNEDGLNAAFAQAKEFLASEAAPAQFILVGLDHGNFEGVQQVQQRSPPGSRSSLAPTLPLPTQQSAREDLLREPDNRPSFVVFVRTPPGSLANLAPAQLTLELARTDDGFTRRLTASSIAAEDNDVVALIFPIDEQQLLDEFFGRTASTTLVNDSQVELQVYEVRFVSGAIAHPTRQASVSRPTSWMWIIGVLLFVAIAVVTVRRLRRRP